MKARIGGLLLTTSAVIGVCETVLLRIGSQNHSSTSFRMMTQLTHQGQDVRRLVGEPGKHKAAAQAIAEL